MEDPIWWILKWQLSSHPEFSTYLAGVLRSSVSWISSMMSTPSLQNGYSSSGLYRIVWLLMSPTGKAAFWNVEYCFQYLLRRVICNIKLLEGSLLSVTQHTLIVYTLTQPRFALPSITSVLAHECGFFTAVLSSDCDVALSGVFVLFAIKGNTANFSSCGAYWLTCYLMLHP